jgi:hypothetical protein
LTRHEKSCKVPTVRVEIVDDERGRKVVVKRAEAPAEAARLRREADLLDVATHPGLVEVIAFDDGATTTMRTAFVGPSLASEPPQDVEEIAGVLAAVASTVADLHSLGLVHGAVAPEHVLLDDDGRAVLCSVGFGGLVGERTSQRPTPAPEFVDPLSVADDDGDDDGGGVPTSGRLDPVADVYALGAVLRFLLSAANGRGGGSAADGLRRLAERAMSSTAPERPSARALADAVHDAVPSARLPRRGARSEASVPPADPLEARRRDRPLEQWRRAQAQVPAPKRAGTGIRKTGAAIVTVAGLAVAVVAVLSGSGAARPGAARPQASPPSPDDAGATEPPASTVPAAPSDTTTMLLPSAITPATAGATPPTTTPTTAAAAAQRGRAGCPAVDGPLAADVDGDGCAEPVRFVDGVIEAGTLRWSVGEAGDVIALGNWSCSGTRSPAVLRPATGEVFAFASWATAGHDVVAPLVGQVAGARTLRAADLDGDGCNEIVVERAQGAPAVLRLPGPGQ